jgi:putative membrane protein
MGVIELHTAHDAGSDDGDERSTGSTEQALTGLLLAVPLVLGLLVTPRALGSSALGGENVANLLLTFPPGPSPLASVAPTPPAPATPIQDIPDLLAYLGQVGELGVGQPVRVAGLVAQSAALEPDEFALLRYAIAHCVADARPLGLLVVAPGQAIGPTDQWVRIEGTLESRDREGDRLVTIVARTIMPIEEPSNPYLNQ